MILYLLIPIFLLRLYFFNNEKLANPIQIGEVVNCGW